MQRSSISRQVVASTRGLGSQNNILFTQATCNSWGGTPLMAPSVEYMEIDLQSPPIPTAARDGMGMEWQSQTASTRGAVLESVDLAHDSPLDQFGIWEIFRGEEATIE